MSSAAATIAEAGRGLTSDELSIDAALDAVLDATGADRVSLSAIDERAATFELLAARGGWLLAPGTRFPTSVSTHFQLAGENATFVGDQLARDPRFDRPIDQLVLAHGFGAGVCLPVRHERGAPGALAIHFRRAGGQARAAVPLVEPLLGALSIALARVRRTPPLEILVCHSDALVARGTRPPARRAARHPCPPVRHGRRRDRARGSQPARRDRHGQRARGRARRSLVRPAARSVRRRGTRARGRREPRHARQPPLRARRPARSPTSSASRSGRRCSPRSTRCPQWSQRLVRAPVGARHPP